jgi:uncharacterized membrane protein
MRRFLSAVRRTSVTLAVASLLAACASDSPTETETLAGTYRAQVFRVTPAGQAPIDVLAAGGSLTITVTDDNVTTGSLSLPASVTGESALTESMAGTVERTVTSIESDGSFRFRQAADTFVRDLVWTRNRDVLSVNNQSAGGARFTIMLAR